MRRGALADVLDAPLVVQHEVGGAGNNWAHGHHGHGPAYRAALSEALRRAAEACDSLQGFLLLHSLGGGTGSGLGTYALSLLADEYPDVLRLSAPVLPSEDDHVVTAPYNALLAAARLAADADAVVPAENQALLDVCARRARADGASGGGGGGTAGEAAAAAAAGAGAAAGGGGGATGNRPWDAMNGVAAAALLDLTAGARFPGSLNVDLGDLAANLVPFPRMHFLTPGVAPLAPPRDLGARGAPRALDALFDEALSRDAQLCWAEPRAHASLATALLLRGAVGTGDAQRNVARVRGGLRPAPWRQDALKVGLCARAPAGLPFSLLALSNSCCFADTLGAMRARFGRLYKRRLFLHHYEEYMDAACFDEAHEAVAALEDAYRAANGRWDGDGDDEGAAAAGFRARGLSFV